VLALNGTVTDEGLLVLDVSKGIEVSEGSNGSNSVLEFRSSEGGGNFALFEREEGKRAM
jgi:hypothetical protein